ncbi:phage antirepressor KilAC domain-containing protein [Paenibacillus sp. GCM10012303]|uniref:phage antirepressor KilAC domain-containing protein n=1 Tax=Paenibacillus sp. GCM10012303 TaxID=3317340 RepID=UPI00360F0311
MKHLVFIENKRPVTDSITVAETFGKNHQHVLRDIRSLECSEEFRVSNFGQTPYVHPQNGQTYEKYLISQDGFTFLVMGYTGKEAARFKEMYITEFNRMREQIQGPVVPRTLPEALRLAADLAEKNEALQLQNAQKEQIINELQPKATYYDLVLLNKSLVPITRIAKDYGMSGQAMNALLHELGVQFKQGDCWLLYQKYADKGYTQSKTQVIDEERSKMHTYWTQKGRLFIYNLLKSKNQLLPVIERNS